MYYARMEINMKIGILAVQGAFIEHERMLNRLAVDHFQIRNQKDMEASCDGIILPGGESTVMGKLIKELNLYKPLKEKIEADIPVLGTCAGMILLAEQIEDSPVIHLATMPIIVKRNAYGRQLGSFRTNEEIKGIGKVPMEFIRAPYVKEIKKGVEILGQVENKIVAVQYKKQIATAFHPELTENTKIHEYFLNMSK